MKTQNRRGGFLIGGLFILLVNLGVGFASEPAGGDVSSPAADWLIDVVDATREVGYNVSVAVDPETGHTYISYYEGVDGDLWLARTGAPVGNCGPGNTWECQVLDSDGIVGKYSSIAVGGTGPVASLYITYHDVTNGFLKVVEGAVDRQTGALTHESSIVDWYAAYSAVALSESGTPHICIQRYNQDIVHATPYEGILWGTCGTALLWDCEDVYHGQGIGASVDIDFDYFGKPVIAFSDFGAEDTHPVVALYLSSLPGGVACNANSDWICYSIQHEGYDTGGYLSLAIRNDRLWPYLAYRNTTTNSLEWASYVEFGGNCGSTGEEWQCDSIESLGPGGSPSGIDIETDENENPVIVYQDASSGNLDLKIARPLEATPWAPAGNCGPLSPTFFPTWLCETLDAGDIDHAEAAGGLSIAMNANGESTVAYRELFRVPPDEGRLKVAIEPISIFVDGFEWGSTGRWSATVP